MPLPLAVVKAAQNSPLMVELKNGDTLSGVLVNCDAFMNLNMKNLVRTSRDGDRFWQISECYIRGNTVKYFRLPEEVLDAAIANATAEKGAATSAAAATSSSGLAGRGRGRGLPPSARAQQQNNVERGRRGRQRGGTGGGTSRLQVETSQRGTRKSQRR